MHSFRKLPFPLPLKVAPMSHRQKVKSLYKRSLQQVANHYGKLGILECRYRQIKIRQEFDKYMDLKDMREIKRLMDEQEEKLKPIYGEEEIKYPFSVGGIAFQREFEVPDAVLDHWHPLQKAQYPEFFAKREELKEEYLKLYEETYGDLLKALHIEKHDTLGLLPHNHAEPGQQLIDGNSDDNKIVK